MEALRIAFEDNLKNEDWANMVALGRFLEKIIITKNQDLILSLLANNWRETFGALEYLPGNYQIQTHTFRVRYLNFLENESKMLIPRASVSGNFTKQVQLRFRAQFLFDFVMLSNFSEESMMFVANVE